MDEREFLVKNGNEFSIDDLYLQNNKKINQQIREVIPGIRAYGNQYFQSKMVPSLNVLLHEFHVKRAQDLAWLEAKTGTFVNPNDLRLEELRQICLKHGINSPILGE